MKLNTYFTQYLLNCIMFSVMIPNMFIHCRKKIVFKIVNRNKSVFYKKTQFHSFNISHPIHVVSM